MTGNITERKLRATENVFLRNLNNEMNYDRTNLFNFTAGDEFGTAEAKKVLIVSTWRSGSTFLGEIIASSPGVFYR